MPAFYTSIEDSDVASSENLNEKGREISYKPTPKGYSRLILALNIAFFFSNLFVLGVMHHKHPLEFRPLEQYSDIAVPEEYMQKLNRTAEGVRLPYGSGYLATLNSHHELHCVEQMYRWINKDKYIPNITEQETQDQLSHLYHCLESLHQSVMCSADLSIVTMRWGARQGTPLANWEAKHTCKNWEAVET